MQDYTAPGVEIKCDGAPLEEGAAKMVAEVSVESRIHLPGSFMLRFVDSSLDFIDKNNGALTEGTKVEIALGYDKEFKKLMTGEISTVSAEMSTQGIYTCVSGYDMLHRLSRGTSYRRYEDTSDSAIAKAIISDAGLRATVDETPTRSIPRVQDNRSDLDFLTILASLNNYFLYCDGDNVFFSNMPPNRGELTLSWGKNLRSFYPRLCLNGRVNSVEARGWDASLDESYVETLSRPREDLLFLSSAGRNMVERGSGGDSVLNLHDSLVTSAGDAKQYIANALRNRQAMVTAIGSCTGNMDLQAGTKLEIENTARFSGSYFVTRAIHRLSRRGYTTDFEVRMAS